MNDLVRLRTDDMGRGIPVISVEDMSKHSGLTQRSVENRIREYRSNLEEFGKLHVERVPSESGQTLVNYYLNEQQATFLMTLFRNTPEVIKFKTNLVKAFFLMRQELMVREHTRHIGKIVRKELMGSIKDNVKDEGNFKKFAYSNYSKLVYKIVFGKSVKKIKEERGLPDKVNLRDCLSIEELKMIQNVEDKVCRYIEMRSDLTSDKEIYQEVKLYLEKLKNNGGLINEEHRYLIKD